MEDSEPVPSWVVDAQTLFEYKAFSYRVSFPLAWTAFALYLAVAVVHTALTLRYARRAYYMYLASLTAVAEAVGYLYRIISVRQHELSPLIATTVLLLVPPIILAIINYEAIGKLLHAAQERVCCLKAHHVSRVFFVADMLCFAIQAGCAGLITSKDRNSQKLGYDVILIGLVLQFVVFVAFVGVAIATWLKPEYRRATIPSVQKVLYVSVFTIGLLLVRNGWRLYEYGLGLSQFEEKQTQVVEGHEWEVYVFDFVPVWTCHVVFAVVNFGWVLPRNEQLRALVESEKSQVAGQGVELTTTEASAPRVAQPTGQAPAVI